MKLKCLRIAQFKKYNSYDKDTWIQQGRRYIAVVYPRENGRRTYEDNRQVIIKYHKGPWAIVDQVSSTTPDVATFSRLKHALIYARLYLS